jgi:hypothetical protein
MVLYGGALRADARFEVEFHIYGFRNRWEPITSASSPEV